MNITDIAAVAVIAKENNILFCVDNTFASPYLQNPLRSREPILLCIRATKYLGGHSDVIQGALVMNDTDLREKLYFIQKSCGAVPGPYGLFFSVKRIKNFTCYECNATAKMELKWLIIYAIIHKVKKVYWAGFEDHPNHEIAKKQMRDFGGMISFELKDESKEAATKLLSSTKLFSLAESLGGVESIN